MGTQLLPGGQHRIGGGRLCVVAESGRVCAGIDMAEASPTVLGAQAAYAAAFTGEGEGGRPAGDDTGVVPADDGGGGGGESGYADANANPADAGRGGIRTCSSSRSSPNFIYY